MNKQLYYNYGISGVNLTYCTGRHTSNVFIDVYTYNKGT